MSSNRYGIASIGIALPPLAMKVEELAALRGVDPDKYTLGLGCSEFALCGDATDAVRLGAEAARRALDRWHGTPDQIGLFVVGTETALDMSRPLSAFIGSELGLRGQMRSYEVKHACLGGTLALRQALEWKASGATKAALVVATDVSLYAPADPGEPTQGAGAVAMIVDAPRVAEIDLDSYAYAEPAFDFWRPVGESYPRVDGPLSLDCYRNAAADCFAQLIGGRDARRVLEDFEHLCFHVPFPKMVKKAVAHLGATLGWDEAETSSLFERKVAPSLSWNRRTGNAYTAALWLSVASVLAGLEPGQRLTAFSYGSGCGAELFALTAGPDARAGAWREDFERDLAARRLVDAKEYAELRTRG